MRTKKISAVIIILSILLWPAVLAFIFGGMGSDFLANFLLKYLFYPSSVSNITVFWYKLVPVSRSLYVSAWYINSLLIAAGYAVYLLNASYRLRVFEERSIVSMASISILSFCCGGVLYSGILFDTTRALSEKEDFLINTDFGLGLMLPLILSMGPIFFVSGVYYFLIILWKLYFKQKEVRNE